jgi:uncharacterized membrane protein
MQNMNSSSSPLNATAQRLDDLLRWMARHWLAVFNMFVALYVILPFVAPLLMSYGMQRPAGWIYKIYAPTCHQLAFRSFFLNGEQIVYPRELAGTGLRSFESYAEHLDDFAGVSLEGLGPDLIISARAFVGNAEMGYKTAICERDLGIFGFLLVGGLLYAVLRHRVRIRPLPLLIFIIIGMGPIALDGFSQLFGYYGEYVSLFQIFPVRESPPWLRTLTGAWFGFCLAWLALPHLDRGVGE